jgi:formylmethanofuran dehydrogenase subunit E
VVAAEEEEHQVTYKRCDRCGERGHDDNPTSELSGEIVCVECEEEADE